MIVRQNLAYTDDESSAERQRLVLNASKELRAILSDIAEEVGGRGKGDEKVEGNAPALDGLDDDSLLSLIETLKAGGGIVEDTTFTNNHINERSEK